MLSNTRPVERRHWIPHLSELAQGEFSVARTFETPRRYVLMWIVRHPEAWVLCMFRTALSTSRYLNKIKLRISRDGH